MAPRAAPSPRQAPPGPGRAFALARDDRAVGDFIGTLLMVTLAVALASVVAVAVFSGLEETAPPSASLSLAPVAQGDAALRVLLRNGEPIPLGALAVTLQRGEDAPEEVPPSAWTTPDPDAWRPGDRLALPLSPVAGADETLRVRVFRTDANALLGELTSQTGGAAAIPSAVALSASLAPPSLVADGVSTSLLSVRASHAEGALAVASVVADLGPASRAAGGGPLLVDLADDGRGGDAVGGDGVWSAAVRVPLGTPPGTYAVTVNATDAWGRLATTTIPLAVPVGASMPVFVGATFEAPTSANVTSFRLRNWTWDALHPAKLDEDALVLRVVGGGRAWTAVLSFDEANGVATARQLRVWSPQAETVYVPRNGTRLPLSGLDMDLLDPVASLQWVYSSGSPHPTALYPAALVQARPQFVVAQMSHDVPRAAEPPSTETGLYGAEVLLR